MRSTVHTIAEASGERDIGLLIARRDTLRRDLADEVVTRGAATAGNVVHGHTHID